MSRNHAEFLDAALVKPSLEAYSDLENAYLMGDRLLSADKIGEIDARRHAQAGHTIDGVDTWIPGRDKVTNLDVQKSLESGEPRTKTRTEHASPNVLHVALDLPPRLNNVEGLYRAKNIGLFALGVTAVIARETEASVKLYLNDGESSDVIYDDPNLDDLYVAYEQVETGQSSVYSPIVAEAGNLAGLLRAVEGSMDYDDDGLVIVSDFQDGYDGKTFDWSPHYSTLDMAVGGRMRAIRLDTPSHHRPNALQAQLPVAALSRVSDEYSEIYNNKQRVLTDILGERALRFSLSQQLTTEALRPSEMLSDYIAHGNL